MAARTFRLNARTWIWIAVVWCGFGLFDAMQTVLVMRSEGMHHAWPQLFGMTVVSWLPWAAATPAILRLGRRFPPVGFRADLTWPAHLTLCIGCAAAFAAWTAWLERSLNPYAQSAPSAFAALWSETFFNGMISSLVLYAAVLAIDYGFESRGRFARGQLETARLNELLSHAQLDALRRQIEPHFLFNTLNGVAGLIREGHTEQAVRMIAALSDFLRRMLTDSAVHEVPLQDELHFTQTYLEIVRMRFADRLQLCIDVPRELYRVTVPQLILQPLVENAVTHGIAKRTAGGTVRIEASQSNGMLVLSVCNDGPGLQPGRESSTGIGIANVRCRLQRLYGDAAGLHVYDRNDGVEAVVRLPVRSAGGA